MSNGPGQQASPNEIGPLEALERIKEGALLLDVREPEEWAAGRATLALHIPLGSLPGRVEELAPEREVVVVCRSGGRSARAAAFLDQAGYRAINLVGGMQAWAGAGLEVVGEDGGPGTVI